MTFQLPPNPGCDTPCGQGPPLRQDKLHPVLAHLMTRLKQ